MISFECDYNNGACQQVIDNLVRFNDAKPTPYGFDEFSERAKALIRKAEAIAAEKGIAVQSYKAVMMLGWIPYQLLFLWTVRGRPLEHLFVWSMSAYLTAAGFGAFQ